MFHHLLAAVLLAFAGRDASAAGVAFTWSRLASLPQHEGLAGPFAGVSGNALLVAGGANFPDKKPWEGGAKYWHDSVFVLNEPDGEWQMAGKLARPLAYGASVTIPDGILCIGGSDASRHYADVFLLQWREGSLKRRSFPALPAPRANMAAAILSNVVYVAGGSDSPYATAAVATFWSLDLASAAPRWTALETWPGPARMLAVSAVDNASFLFFSGVELRKGQDGKPVRSYLRDAFRYSPGSGWNALPLLPRAAAGAPSPAPTIGSRVVIISGDDGSLVDFEPKSKHPGFPRNALIFDPILEWSQLAAPLTRATVPTVAWRGRIIIPNGETRPGSRTPEVWTFDGNTRD